MPRHTSAMLLAVLAAAVLAGCAPSSGGGAGTGGTRESSPAAAPASPASVDPVAAADVLCAESSRGEGEACVLEGVTAADDLRFTSYRVVKLIGGSFDGTVEISGAEEAIVIDGSFGGDLTLDPRGGSVVKVSTIAGTLAIDGGHGATVVDTTIGADLRCAAGVQAGGGGNDVAGAVTGTCDRTVRP